MKGENQKRERESEIGRDFILFEANKTLIGLEKALDQ
jgi:hypothetical protein